MSNTILNQDTQVPREIPAAGTANQALTKNSAADYDTGWATQPTVNNGQLTIQKAGTNLATFTANQAGASTANIGRELPAGGSTNQLLTKLSNTDYDVGWRNETPNPTVGNGTITIQKNGTTLGSFTVNQNSNATINIPAATYSIYNIGSYISNYTTVGVGNVLNKTFSAPGYGYQVFSVTLSPLVYPDTNKITVALYVGSPAGPNIVGTNQFYPPSSTAYCKSSSCLTNLDDTVTTWAGSAESFGTVLSYSIMTIGVSIS